MQGRNAPLGFANTAYGVPLSILGALRLTYLSRSACL